MEKTLCFSSSYSEMNAEWHQIKLFISDHPTVVLLKLFSTSLDYSNINWSLFVYSHVKLIL